DRAARTAAWSVQNFLASAYAPVGRELPAPHPTLAKQAPRIGARPPIFAAANYPGPERTTSRLNFARRAAFAITRRLGSLPRLAETQRSEGNLASHSISAFSIAAPLALSHRFISSPAF